MLCDYFPPRKKKTKPNQNLELYYSVYNDWPLLMKDKVILVERKVPDMKRNIFIPQTLNILSVHLVQGHRMHALSYTTSLERGAA